MIYSASKHMREVCSSWKSLLDHSRGLLFIASKVMGFERGDIVEITGSEHDSDFDPASYVDKFLKDGQSVRLVHENDNGGVTDWQQYIMIVPMSLPLEEDGLFGFLCLLREKMAFKDAEIKIASCLASVLGHLLLAEMSPREILRLLQVSQKDINPDFSKQPPNFARDKKSLFSVNNKKAYSLRDQNGNLADHILVLRENWDDVQKDDFSRLDLIHGRYGVVSLDQIYYFNDMVMSIIGYCELFNSRAARNDKVGKYADKIIDSAVKAKNIFSNIYFPTSF